MTTSVHVVEAADRLLAASESGVPCAPVRDVIGSTHLGTAYAVQAELTRRRLDAGARLTGRKIGLTSPAVQAQLGVDRPDFGTLFADMAYPDGATVPIDRLLQPKVEAEVAFVLRNSIETDVSGEDGPRIVADAVDFAVAALEIVDSRVADWDITITDTIADNGSSGLYVLGTERRTLDRFVPRDVTMSMSVDGAVVSEGDGAACLGDPLNALRWLAATALELGAPLQAGDVVLSGALGPMAPVAAGNSVVATISGFGDVSAHFSKEVSP